jgi:hypothetical protein
MELLDWLELQFFSTTVLYLDLSGAVVSISPVSAHLLSQRANFPEEETETQIS